jgi:HEAT repeat protein
VAAQNVVDEPSLELDGKTRTGLALILLDHERSPSPESLQAFEGELDVPAELMAMASNPALDSSLRGRALRALAFYPSEEAEHFVSELLQTLPPEQNYVRVSAIITLTHALEAYDPLQRIDLLSTLSTDENSAIRELAVMGFGPLRQQNELRPLVDERLLQLVIAERNPSVSEALHSVLKDEPQLEPAAMPKLAPSPR